MTWLSSTPSIQNLLSLSMIGTLLTLLTGLASWRIAHMLVYEYGPFGIFQLVRSLFGIRHTARGEIMTFSHRNVLNCVWCTSVWVALGLTLLLLLSLNAGLIVTLIFAAASVPPLIELWQERPVPSVTVNNQLPPTQIPRPPSEFEVAQIQRLQRETWDDLPDGVKHGGRQTESVNRGGS